MLTSQTIVSTHPVAASLSSKNFESPLDFQPERWLGENNKDYLEAAQPFSLGPRGCLGRKYARKSLFPALGTRAAKSFTVLLGSSSKQYLQSCISPTICSCRTRILTGTETLGWLLFGRNRRSESWSGRGQADLESRQGGCEEVIVISKLYTKDIVKLQLRGNQMVLLFQVLVYVAFHPWISAIHTQKAFPWMEGISMVLFHPSHRRYFPTNSDTIHTATLFMDNRHYLSPPPPPSTPLSAPHCRQGYIAVLNYQYYHYL